MTKFTPFKFDDSLSFPIEENSLKNKIPKKVKRETIDNIIAFTKAYSVRPGSIIEKVEMILN